MSGSWDVDLVWLDRLAFYNWLVVQPAGKVVGYASSFRVNPLASYLEEVTGCACLVFACMAHLCDRERADIRMFALPAWASWFMDEMDAFVDAYCGVTKEQALEVLAHIPEEVEV